MRALALLLIAPTCRGLEQQRAAQGGGVGASRMDATVPVPTAAQLRYQRNEISALIHFNMGTYACASGTGYSGCRECWLGNAANASRNCAEVAGPGQLARTFNPTQLSTDNWAESIVALGARAAVLTAKHDSGHLLWPTNVTLPGGVEYTYAVGHSESAIQVDVLRLFTESMQRHGLGHGFYYSIGNNVYLNVKNAVLQTGHTDHSGGSFRSALCEKIEMPLRCSSSERTTTITSY